MLFEKLKFSFGLLFTLAFTSLQAQESINATGGDASGSGGTASYSIGQVVYTTNTETNGAVAQGVQQPYEISDVIGITEAQGIKLSVSAYPNPTDDNLKLSIDATTMLTILSMSYKLYDLNGKLLQNEQITNNQTNIVMRNLVSATYFVKVFQDNNEVKTFKVIKN